MTFKAVSTILTIVELLARTPICPNILFKLSIVSEEQKYTKMSLILLKLSLVHVYTSMSHVLFKHSMESLTIIPTMHISKQFLSIFYNSYKQIIFFIFILL
jgi:hypothetical protein